MAHANPSLQAGTNRYLYNGKELQVTGGLKYLDYGARMSDARIARWFGIDLLAEKYFGISPYVFVNNNPIRIIDPDGRDWFYHEKTGSIYYHETHDESYTKYLGEGWVHWGSNNMFDVSDRDLLQMFCGTFGKISQDGSSTAYIGSQMHIQGGMISDFLSSVDHIPVPAQQFINEQGYIQYVPTGPYSVRTETGAITSITEKIAYVHANSELSNSTIIQTINTNTGFGSIVKAFVVGQKSVASRVIYEYQDSSTRYSPAISPPGTGYNRVHYQNWDTYSNSTKGKGRLLKYR